jgi:hypothetical protein
VEAAGRRVADGDIELVESAVLQHRGGRGIGEVTGDGIHLHGAAVDWFADVRVGQWVSIGIGRIDFAQHEPGCGLRIEAGAVADNRGLFEELAAYPGQQRPHRWWIGWRGGAATGGGEWAQYHVDQI